MTATHAPMGADPHRFEFDLDRGIREQVVEKLKASGPVRLDLPEAGCGFSALCAVSVDRAQTQPCHASHMVGSPNVRWYSARVRVLRP